MVDAMWAWAEANQPIAMTPFLLAGATAPVSVAAGLSLQVAEALSGVAIAQAVRPGVGCFFGSFFSGVDMRSGGPSLGMPESVLGSIAGGQLARRYGLPFRGGGGLTLRPTRSTPRRRRSRRCRSGARTSRAATSCCTRPAGSRAA